MSLSRTEALEIFLNSTQEFEELKKNVFQNKTSFRVIVLTDPERISADVENPGIIRSDPNGNSLIFKGRIEDTNMSHVSFITNPCDESVLSEANKETSALLVSLHSNIVLTNANDIPELSPGDIVVAEIEPGDNDYLYSLQNMFMTALEIEKAAGGGTSISEDCESIISQFDAFTTEVVSAARATDVGGLGSNNPNPYELADDPAEQCESDEFFIMNPIGADIQTNSGFKTESRPNHIGIDLSTWNPNNSAGTSAYYASEGIEVYAATDGIVTTALAGCDGRRPNDTCNGGAGNYVVIQHDNTYLTRYLHLLEDIKVKNGDVVNQGDLIGYIGNSGWSRGSHLHFEVQKNNTPVDPNDYIKVKEKCPSNG
jgi:hypothetical protein